ncbi:hypothetical protein [Bosea sp. 685]|uniref:hypothetical protein n=1 Tax=Bosea sp. 685 TaxID=3080057 RepID=UPI002892AD74|nr:hypothetical protein [Bosea sp. 685]WNJ93012.1 hypothetical protein RMR04_12280 [Bosea sp. 685]
MGMRRNIDDLVAIFANILRFEGVFGTAPSLRYLRYCRDPAKVAMLSIRLSLANRTTMPMSLRGPRNVAALPLVMGVGLSSSAIPCVRDLAVARLSCGTHRLMPSLFRSRRSVSLCCVALRWTPAAAELLGITFAIAVIAIHRPKRPAP